jgi:2-keto-3-deoxy-L-rhamnonate aldolase RhmA
MGVIAPHVDTVDQAMAVVDGARLAPVGRRSAYTASPVLGFRNLPLADALAALDRETTVAVMIESREGVGNAAQIAAVDGVDMLLVGTFDLTRDLGASDVRDPAVRAALVAVADACRTTGTTFGVLGLRDTDVLGELVSLGLQFIGAGNDLGLLQEATRANVTRLRRLQRPGQELNR